MYDTSLNWDTIYSVPPIQRGSFWVWLNAKKHNRMLHLEADGKCDELGLVAGYSSELYDQWLQDVWQGIVVYPSHRYNGKSYTVVDCDNVLYKEGKLKDDFDTRIFEIKHSLVEFMLHPYRHDVFYIDNEKEYTWYDIENELNIAHTMLLKNPNMRKLFYSLQARARELTNQILGLYYNYSNTFKQ